MESKKLSFKKKKKGKQIQFNKRNKQNYEANFNYSFCKASIHTENLYAPCTKNIMSHDV